MESFPGAECLIVDLFGNDCQPAVKYASMTNCGWGGSYEEDNCHDGTVQRTRGG